MKNSERGQSLPLAMLVLALGTLIISPFLGHASSSLIGSRIYAQAMTKQYSCGAGVEHAIWRLTNGGLADQLLNIGDNATYQLDETINGIAPSIAVTRLAGSAEVSVDDFESGGLSGGSNWLDAWHRNPDNPSYAKATAKESPYEGDYHLKITKQGALLSRAANLSGLSGLHLQLAARVNSFRTGNSLTCQVSPDGTEWNTIRTWTNSDSDGIYQLYDFDLSGFTMSGEFWLALHAVDFSPGSAFYVDDVKIIDPGSSSSTGEYEIISTAGEDTINTIIRIVGQNVYILSWQIG